MELLTDWGADLYVALQKLDRVFVAIALTMFLHWVMNTKLFMSYVLRWSDEADAIADKKLRNKQGNAPPLTDGEGAALAGFVVQAGILKGVTHICVVILVVAF